ncbi:isocitrate lyase/phosphoenolpyruvate mutase family protein [Pseudoroseomonas wenyumeiae]
MNQTEQVARFRALHARPGAVVIPNPWDAGSARILAALGFEALATTSAGLAFSLGRPDGQGAVSREETLANAAAIVAATSLPVSADLENGFGHAPEDCAETIRAAAGVGLAGGSIEDATGEADRPSTTSTRPWNAWPPPPRPRAPALRADRPRRELSARAPGPG